jgi:hypothetical protein
VVGVKGFFDRNGRLNSVGIECALCHSTVDNSFAPGIGHRLDGWANRDLNVGAIVGLSPNLQPVASLLHTDVATVHKVLDAWGPGKFDAELFMDGKAFQPNGTSAATLIPPAFGLAGVNLHTWTGWGSIPYWNAFVAVLEMHGQGTFFDARLDNAAQFPIAAENHFGHVNATGGPGQRQVARVAGLPALVASTQGAEGVVRPGGGSARQGDVQRQRRVLDLPRATDVHRAGQQPAPGQPDRHRQLRGDRSPTHMYRTSPLAGLWSHQKGGFYHDGRFPDLLSVVKHYDSTFHLGLSARQQNDLVQYLLSL